MPPVCGRREFFAITAAALAGLAGASTSLTTLCAGMDFSGADTPSGPTVSGNKVLVAYATRCSSTKEVAQALVHDLGERGLLADLRLMEQVTSLEHYRGVVLGSAVRFGKWLPEASGFVQKFRAKLQGVPTAFFSVHLMNIGADEASRKARLGYTAPIRGMVQPGAEAFFAGRMDIARLSFGERLMCRVMKAHNEDKRDWPAIHAWGRAILPAA